jgi:hypothetical protein
MNLASHRSVLGIYTGSSPVKHIFAWLSHHTRSIRCEVLELTTTCAALGGHFWGRRPWWRWCCWSLAVGRWCLRGHKFYIRLGIVWNKFMPV